MFLEFELDFRIEMISIVEMENWIEIDLGTIGIISTRGLEY